MDAKNRVGASATAMGQMNARRKGEGKEMNRHFLLPTFQPWLRHVVAILTDKETRSI